MKEKKYEGQARRYRIIFLHADAEAVIVVSARRVTCKSYLMAIGLKMLGMWIS